MRLILNKTTSLYIFILFVCLVLNSCSALKTCDCPGIGTQNNAIENPNNAYIMKKNSYNVIMAGDIGGRLWPMSRVK